VDDNCGPHAHNQAVDGIVAQPRTSAPGKDAVVPTRRQSKVDMADRQTDAGARVHVSRRERLIATGKACSVAVAVAAMLGAVTLGRQG
jgi:hypothetical protein